MVKFSKYELYNKLLDDVTLFKITLGVTLNIYIYIYIYKVLHSFSHLKKALKVLSK